MGFKISYVYEIIDNYSAPLSTINDKTSTFKKLIADMNKSGGLKTYNRNLSRTAKLYDGMARPLTKLNQKIGQNTRSARGFNDQLTISRGNMKALKREAAAFKATMPRAPNIVPSGGGGGMAMGAMGAGLIGRLTPIAAAVGATMIPLKAYQAGSSFEYKMVSAMAKMGDVTKEQSAALKASAFMEAKKTKFTTGDVADAIDTMAKAGFKVNEIIDSLGGVLRLSQSTDTDIVTSSEIAASSLRAFGLQANQMALVADMFAQTASSANTDVSKLGYAMKYVGPIAAKMGYDLETMLGVIATISDEGVTGEMAGTSTRAIITRLSADKTAQAALSAIGVNPRDSLTGEMKDFPSLIGEINEGLKKVPRQNQEQFLTAIAGMEAISAFSIMLGNVDKMQKKTAENKAALGTTERIQKLKEDTVLGQQERLDSATNVLLTNMGLLGNSAFGVQEKLQNLADFIGRQSDYFMPKAGSPEGTKSPAEIKLNEGLKGLDMIPAISVGKELLKLLNPVDSFNEDMDNRNKEFQKLGLWRAGSDTAESKSKVDINVKVDSEGKATATVDSSGPSVGNLGVSMGS